MTRVHAGSTSCVAEGLQVEGQLLHALPRLLIVLSVLRTANQGNWLSLRNLRTMRGGGIEKGSISRKLSMKLGQRQTKSYTNQQFANGLLRVEHAGCAEIVNRKLKEEDTFFFALSGYIK